MVAANYDRNFYDPWSTTPIEFVDYNYDYIEDESQNLIKNPGDFDFYRYNHMNPE
jgi:hypothetical protein